MPPQSTRAQPESRIGGSPHEIAVPRSSLLLLQDDTADAIAFALWRVAADLDLWMSTAGSAGIYASGARPDSLVVPSEPEAVASALRALHGAIQAADADARELARAASEVWQWAETNKALETALQYAELAARLDPANAVLAAAASRIARAKRLWSRSTVWGRYALSVARRQQNQLDVAIAALTLGNLEAEQGRHSPAERWFVRGYRAAVRAGRHTLAALAQHDLFALKINTHRWDQAWEHAYDALRLYLVQHPRFPFLAYDCAFFLQGQGYFSSVVPLLERILPCVERSRERMLVLSTFARCAGAARDRVRFERAAARTLEMVEEGGDLSPGCIYYVAEGARYFDDQARARALAVMAGERAKSGAKPWVAAAVGRCLEAIDRGEPPVPDTIPPEGGRVDQLIHRLLVRLQKHTAPRDRRAVPPERFPRY